MKRYLFAASVLFTAAVSMTASGQLYEENFEVDPTANWTLNGAGNVDVPESHQANFFFDYSDVGIPKAPNSGPDDGTRGMKLQTNLDFDNDGISGVPLGGVTGMSVSPNGQSFTGDYQLTFDAWGNFPGPFPAGSSGTTQLSTFGVGTSGTSANYPGTADSIWFAASHDGGSSADYRVYSQERSVSYQVPHDPAVLDNMGQPIDSHATYLAGSRNNTAQLYLDTFDPQSAPAAQLTEYPQQTGMTNDGTFGMAWHEVEISWIGNMVEWKVDGTTLITLDTTNFVSQPAGTNILFGSSDINAGASSDPERFNLLFTLIDNIKVEAVSAINPDFNGDGFVNAADYPVWLATDGTQAGYDAWVAAFGTSVGSGGGGSPGVIPEPGALVMAALGMLLCIAGCRHRA
jgi:hypothetical protein